MRARGGYRAIPECRARIACQPTWRPRTASWVLKRPSTDYPALMYQLRSGKVHNDKPTTRKQPNQLNTWRKAVNQMAQDCVGNEMSVSYSCSSYFLSQFHEAIFHCPKAITPIPMAKTPIPKGDKCTITTPTISSREWQVFFFISLGRAHYQEVLAGVSFDESQSVHSRQVGACPVSPCTPP